jgi:hypothetical protein
MGSRGESSVGGLVALCVVGDLRLLLGSTEERSWGCWGVNSMTIALIGWSDLIKCIWVFSGIFGKERSVQK